MGVTDSDETGCSAREEGDVRGNSRSLARQSWGLPVRPGRRRNEVSGSRSGETWMRAHSNGEVSQLLFCGSSHRCYCRSSAFEPCW